MSVAIVFYSREGNTREASRLISEKTGGFLVELKEGKTRKGFLGFLSGGIDALGKKGCKLSGNPERDIAPSDIVVIGTPIWAGNGTPAVNEFLRRSDLKGKKCHIFCVQASETLEGSTEVLEWLSSLVREKGGEVAGCFALRGSSPGKPVDSSLIRQGLEAHCTL